MRNLSNITLDELRRVLQLAGLAFDGVSGGHEKWSKAGMTRPVIFQTHKEPVPEFIVRNHNAGHRDEPQGVHLSARKPLAFSFPT
ncbi:MAG: hypothetical protein LUI09_06245 [Prevotellaceae bacterium]|nr:hypothetical protein [Prevotellaceae bacterium]